MCVHLWYTLRLCVCQVFWPVFVDGGVDKHRRKNAHKMPLCYFVYAFFCLNDLTSPVRALNLIHFQKEISSIIAVLTRSVCVYIDLGHSNIRNLLDNQFQAQHTHRFFYKDRMHLARPIWPFATSGLRFHPITSFFNAFSGRKRLSSPKG